MDRAHLINITNHNFIWQIRRAKLRNPFCTKDYVHDSVRGLVGITLNYDRHWCEALVLEAVLLPLVDIINSKERVVELLARFIKPFIADSIANAILNLEDDGDGDVDGNEEGEDREEYAEDEESIDSDTICEMARREVWKEEQERLKIFRGCARRKGQQRNVGFQFNGKLGDFGLARVVERDQAASHTTVVAGTLGYLAPECCITGKTSPEADVYSFGAVSLEIACGRRPVDLTLGDHNCRLVEWAWDLYGQGKLRDAVDKKHSGNFKEKEMERLVMVGLLCSHPDPSSRPTMREVTKILKWKAELAYVPLDLPVPVYNEPLRLDVTSALPSSPAQNSSIVNEMLSTLNASVLSSSMASCSSGKMSSSLPSSTGHK
ncbi:probable L-type lectin-domain containing receptor kinase S.5 [Cryptomeria japonica]|uniref:probable L-type lectin-domain containing receptor kinase S.5 n=1 Tax=Cryptomeria japonica TaxID=3369 RepID=UPI0027DAAC3F|nr:probable L-type lectin-domain containing receptor kinase S.5 [Cryptomeria japonica]